MRFFLVKISIFMVTISDDLFLSHRPGFSNFPFLFPHFPYVYYVKCRISPFPHKKTTFFPRFIFSRASDNTTSQNIGGTNAWAVLHLKLWGDRPPIPPRSPSLLAVHP